MLGYGPSFTRTTLSGPLEPRSVLLNPGFGSFQAVGPDGRGLVVTDQGLVSRPLLVGRVNVRRLTRR